MAPWSPTVPVLRALVTGLVLVAKHAHCPVPLVHTSIPPTALAKLVISLAQTVLCHQMVLTARVVTVHPELPHAPLANILMDGLVNLATLVVIAMVALLQML